MVELSVLVSTGATHEDPSEDLLLEFLQDIEHDHTEFFIITRTTDDSGGTYAQVITNESGGWTVERREGASDAHFSLELASIQQAHQILSEWAFETGSDGTSDWQRLEL